MSRRTEVWRDIPGYAGWYQASDWGRVRSFRKLCNQKDRRSDTPRILNPYHDKRKSVLLYKLSIGDQQNNVPAARITAFTFLGGVPEGMIAYHINRDITDNSVWNVAVGPWTEMIQSYREENGRTSRRRPVVKLDRDLTVTDCYRSARQAGRENRISYRTICDYCNLIYKNTVFAKDGYIYAWDADNWLRKTLQRARAELDAMNARYNDPCTECYYDLPAAPEIEFDPDILWSDAPACAGGGGGTFGINLTLTGA